MALHNRIPDTGQLVPGSEQHLRLFTRQDRKQDFFRPLARRGVVDHFHDFGTQAAASLTDYFAVANAAGAGAANFVVTTDAENGIARGNTGTTDDGSISLISPIILFGDRNCFVQGRFLLDVVTGVSFEFGLIDAVPAANGPGVSDIDTPAFTAADCALLHMDTDQTLTTMAFATNGSTAGQPDQKTNLAAPSILTPVAATYVTCEIRLIGNNASCFVQSANGGFFETKHAFDAQGHTEGGVALAVWVYVRTRNTTAKVPDIDYLWFGQDRN